VATTSTYDAYSHTTPDQGRKDTIMNKHPNQESLPMGTWRAGLQLNIPRTARAVRLADDEFAYAKELGHGNASYGIRLALCEVQVKRTEAAHATKKKPRRKMPTRKTTKTKRQSPRRNRKR